MAKIINKNKSLISTKILVPSNVISANNEKIKTRIVLKKNNKKTYLLISCYIMSFMMIIAVVLVLMGNNHIKTGTNNFNPGANDDIWEQYYHDHKTTGQLIDLSDMGESLRSPSRNPFVINIDNRSNINNGNVNYQFILAQIDGDLTNEKLEGTAKVPTNFFSNVIYNPGALLTVGNTNIDNYDFKISDKFNDSSSYNLNFSTSKDCEAFGIKAGSNSFTIKINVKNEIAVNIADLDLSNLTTKIAIANPQKASVQEVVDKFLEKVVSENFVTQLAQKLNLQDKSKIKKEYYNIVFKDINETKDFTTNQKLDFTIKTTTVSQTDGVKFTGNLADHINVTNENVDLSQETGLKTKLETDFDGSAPDKRIDIEFDNVSDSSNVDTKLTAKGVEWVKTKVQEKLQREVENYLTEQYPLLDISNSDYTLDIGVAANDNLFNVQDKDHGKKINVTIEAATGNYKLTKNLTVNVFVYTHNKTSVNQTCNSDPNFKMDGIYLKDKKHANEIQDGDRSLYAQTSLMNQWINGPDSLLQTMNKDAYNVVANSFTGTIKTTLTLGSTKDASIKQDWKIDDIDIAKIANSAQNINNFYDLLTKTKYIYFLTSVSTQPYVNRSLNDIKLLFTSDVKADTVLYSIDLCPHPGCIITAAGIATLTFKNFDFTINYQQNN